MRVLGIDPGLAIVGWGIIDSEGSKIKYIAHGTIETPAGLPIYKRLLNISLDLQNLINQYKPDEIAMEELFFAKNVKTALQVSAARGCCIAQCAMYTNELYEYTPKQIKQALVGYGGADKKQIQYMVKLLLGLDKIPKPDDAADGLAVAITHSNVGYDKISFKMK